MIDNHVHMMFNSLSPAQMAALDMNLEKVMQLSSWCGAIIIAAFETRTIGPMPGIRGLQKPSNPSRSYGCLWLKPAFTRNDLNGRVWVGNCL